MPVVHLHPIERASFARSTWRRACLLPTGPGTRPSRSTRSAIRPPFRPAASCGRARPAPARRVARRHHRGRGQRDWGGADLWGGGGVAGRPPHPEIEVFRGDLEGWFSGSQRVILRPRPVVFGVSILRESAISPGRTARSQTLSSAAAGRCGRTSPAPTRSGTPRPGSVSSAAMLPFNSAASCGRAQPAPVRHVARQHHSAGVSGIGAVRIYSAVGKYVEVAGLLDWECGALVGESDGRCRVHATNWGAAWGQVGRRVTSDGSGGIWCVASVMLGEWQTSVQTLPLCRGNQRETHTRATA